MIVSPQRVHQQWKILLSLTLALGVPGVTAAPLLTGADLVAACRDEQNPGPCMNYLLNMADGYEAFSKWGAVPQQWCMPPGMSHIKLQRIYLRYTDSHAEVLKLPTNQAVSAAFTLSFPCSEERPGQAP